jgi:predicted homoserine dehydrogenase-like protein
MNVDTALRERAEKGEPIRVGIVGAGATGRAIALQMATPPTGIRLAAIANRTIATGERSFREAGVSEWSRASSAREAETAIVAGRPVLTDDASVLTDCSAIDIIVEVTGTVDAAAHVAMRSFDQGKPVVLVNAELDSLLGPILKAKADAAGVVLTHTDGDEPGVAMTLVRYVRTLGLRVVAAGNIKGMVDYYRTPATQQKFAETHDQDVRKVTSFADATKLSMETTVLANATGFHCGKRGMHGPTCAKVQDLAGLLPPEEMLATGIVDYSVGAAPHTGGFVVVYEPNKLKQVQLAYYKMGDGPFYVLHTPFHLPHLQIMSTIGRAVALRDATVAPLGGPVTEVVAVAKRDLKVGERLDGIGGFCTYGLIENTAVARAADAMPIALSEGCVLRRDVAKDSTIVADDVDQPVRDPLIEKLWREQCARWAGSARTDIGGPRSSRSVVDAGRAAP